MVYLEAQDDGAVFSTLTNGPHPLYVPLIMLILDCILYLLLAVYLDQVLPGKHTHLYTVTSYLLGVCMVSFIVFYSFFFVHKQAERPLDKFKTSTRKLKISK